MFIYSDGGMWLILGKETYQDDTNHFKSCSLQKKNCQEYKHFDKLYHKTTILND